MLPAAWSYLEFGLFKTHCLLYSAWPHIYVINGSNVNDYPPMDTLELSSDHLIEVWLIILLLNMVDGHPVFWHPSHCCFAHPDGLGLSFLQNKPLPLKYVKFQNVRRYIHFTIYIYAFVSCHCFYLTAFCYYFSLTVFIEDNQSGSDVSKIQKVALYGTT
jgi:hypothetical protein